MENVCEKCGNKVESGIDRLCRKCLKEESEKKMCMCCLASKGPKGFSKQYALTNGVKANYDICNKCGDNMDSQGRIKGMNPNYDGSKADHLTGKIAESDDGLHPEMREMHNALGCPGCKFEDGEKTFKGPCCTRLGGPVPDVSGHCEAARYRVNIGEGEWAWVSVPGKEGS